MAVQERDELDQYEPPPAFDGGYLYFRRPAWDSIYSRFASDIRPQVSGGQTWDFEVRNPGLTESVIAARGIESLPEDLRAVLICMNNTIPIDLRVTPEHRFLPTADRTQFRIIAGTPEFVDAELAKLLPAEFMLHQNYPNPFNATTMFTYGIPEPSEVSLVIYSVLGQEVRTLVRGAAVPGIYTVRWDGISNEGGTAASGVYFMRMTAGSSVVRTIKLTMLR
jgi:hypothetical protein